MNIALISVEKLLNANTRTEHMPELPVIVPRRISVQGVVNLHIEVQDRMREAALTLWRSPRPTEEKYLRSGERCSWPQYVRDWHAYGADRARMPKIPPQPEAIDRMEEVLGWISWLATQDTDEAKIVWFSFGIPTRTKLLAGRLGVHRETIKRKRETGIQRILYRFFAESAVG